MCRPGISTQMSATIEHILEMAVRVIAPPQLQVVLKRVHLA